MTTYVRTPRIAEAIYGFAKMIREIPVMIISIAAGAIILGIFLSRKIILPRLVAMFSSPLNFFVAAVIIIEGTLVYVFWDDPTEGALLSILATPMLFLAVSLIVFYYVTSEDTREKELRSTLSRAEAAAEKEPEKAKPLWDLSRASFELYVNRNLAQVSRIFWITIAIMAAGFGLACYGVYRAFDAQLQVAVLTAGAGVITQAIGATFMLIYRSTMKQATDYVAMLERINSVGMAVSIVDAISTDGEKNKARIELVKQILAAPRKALPKVD